MPKINNTRKIINSKKTYILAALVVLISLIATANLTIFNKPVSNIGSSSASTQEPADTNADGAVDIIDLSILLSAWGQSGVVADIDNDSTVDIVDLSILLSNWD